MRLHAVQQGRRSALMSRCNPLLFVLLTLLAWIGSAGAQTITNPGFETGTESGWLSGGAVHGVSTSAAHSGTYGQYNNGAWNGVGQNVSGFSPSTAYTVTVWAKLANGVPGNNQSVYISQDGGTTKTRQYITSAAWTQFTFNFTTGSNTSVQIGNEEVSGSSAIAYVDDWTVASGSGGLPSGWAAADIGGPTPAGSSSESSGTYTVKGGGADIWNTSDQFQFCYNSLSGDGSVVANCTAVQDTNTWAKAGVMFRDGTAANAMYAYAAITPFAGVTFQYRTTTGGDADGATTTGVTAPKYLKVQRAGNSFSAYYSTNGTSWTQIGSAVTIAIPSAAKAGLAVTSHAQGTLNTSTFTDVSIAAGGSAPAAPTGLTATAGDAQVTLSWNASSGATTYNVYRGTSAGGQDTTPIATGVTSTGYNNTGLTNGTAYYYKVAAVNSYGTSGMSNEASATPQAPSTIYQPGMNVGGIADWEPTRPFADLVKSSRQWNVVGSGTAAPIDSYGWPTTDATLGVFGGLDQMHGTYALSFTGEANLSVTYNNGTISNKVYIPGTNTTTATLVITDTGSLNFALTFTGTKRTSASATNTGITDLKIIRPTTPGGSTACTGIFYQPYLNQIARVPGVLRTMDLTATNSNPQTTWSTRATPQHCSQLIGDGTTSSPVGAAWEYVIALANATNRDVWICVPCQADNDYITKMAQLFRYGSDGVNPYTSPQANPVWPPLNSNLKVYVEWSNELWNSAGAFQQYQQNLTYSTNNPSPMNFDGKTGEWVNHEFAQRRVAVRTVDISNSWRSVWGDFNMMTRVRPVIMSQLGYWDGPSFNRFDMLMNYYNNPAYVATPRHPSYYIYAFSGSAYATPADNCTTVDQVLNSLPPANFAPEVAADTHWAKAFGLQHIAYEGGPDIGFGHTDPSYAAAVADSRMKDEVINIQDVFSQNGGDELVHFTLAGDYHWGYLTDVVKADTPKMQAIDAIKVRTRATPTTGTLVPATISAGSFNAPPGWTTVNPSSASTGRWWTYTIRTTSAGNRTVVINTTASTAGGSLEVWADQTKLGTLTIPVGTGFDTTAGTINLPAGVHGILLHVRGGSFSINQVKVN